MDQTTEKRLLFRRPRVEDGKAVHDLIRRSPPLDVNSAYNYFLLCSHFSETCVVVEKEGVLVGFISAYREPAQMERLFVWQVAVDSDIRGQGLAGRMLHELLSRPACHGVRWIETTISPSNSASRRVFESLAKARAVRWEEEIFLSREDFGGEAHEEEILYRIGPIDQQENENANF
jgi:L-2,4-diaminobutyric acid acetyltransferase